MFFDPTLSSDIDQPRQDGHDMLYIAEVERANAGSNTVISTKES